jgi:hypothetical protein
MLVWLIVLLLLAITLCPAAPPSAVARVFSPLEVAIYPSVKTDGGVTPTVPGPSGTLRALVGTICPKTRTRATAPRWQDAADARLAGIVPDLWAERRGLVV